MTTRLIRDSVWASLLAVVAAGLWVAGSAFWWDARTAPAVTETAQKSERVRESLPPSGLPAEPAPAAAPAALPALALLSTSVAENPALSIATLMDQDSEATELVRPGDSLGEHPEIAVSKIGPRWVEFTDGDRAWVLGLARESARRVVGPEDLQRILGDPDLTTDDRVRQLLTAGAGERTVENILSEASFAPYVDEDGALAGLYLAAVRPDGFYARLGLAAGDVLREINGVRIDDPDALREATQILQAEPSLHLIVESGGEIRRVLVDLEPGHPVLES